VNSVWEFNTAKPAATDNNGVIIFTCDNQALAAMALMRLAGFGEGGYKPVEVDDFG
jgi:hypothetical protein